MRIREQKSLNGFKFGTFIDRFPSDGAATMAVKGLRCGVVGCLHGPPSPPAPPSARDYTYSKALAVLSLFGRAQR